MTPEEDEKRINDRFERIEKLLESTTINFKANLESLQDFMAGAFRRSEERMEKLDQRLDRISKLLVHTAELLERHVSDGHGGEEEEEES